MIAARPAIILRKAARMAGHGRFWAGARMLRAVLGLLAALTLCAPETRAAFVAADGPAFSESQHQQALPPFTDLSLLSADEFDEWGDDAPLGHGRPLFDGARPRAHTAERSQTSGPSRSRSSHFPTGPPDA